VVAVGFVAARLPSYLTFDTGDSLVELQPDFPETHYLLLSIHIFFGSIALIACSLQVWPWLRNTYPRVHRITGRVYVIAGVLPAGLLALAVSVVSTIDVAGRIGNVMLSLLWLGSTFAGFHYARKRRFREHRRMMIYSFAICWSIVLNRVWLAIFFIALMPLESTYYNGDFDAMIADVAVASIWTGWVVNLIIAEWWLNRRPKARKRTAPATKVAVGA
jgi:uncharacterized membrane protein